MWKSGSILSEVSTDLQTLPFRKKDGPGGSGAQSYTETAEKIAEKTI